MIKISKRLQSVVDFINKNDSLVDIGCDHGYLSIYLRQNNLCNKIIASDINQNALNNAIFNIRKNNLDIETVLSDGIKNVDLSDINTLIITGMGAKTILHILDTDKIKDIKKIVLQSNNDYELLREKMNEIGFYLEKENIVYDKDIWYITMLFIRSDQENSLKEKKYGFLNNKLYCNYLIKKYEDILSKLPDNLIEERNEYLDKIKYIKSTLQ